MTSEVAKTTGAQYHCDYCRRDISNTIRIRCAECADFDLCLECFSVGVEVFPHKNSHKYRVIDLVTTPIFEEEWGADEELLLLEAIEMYGLGNWSDVSDHVGTKSRTKCENHYYTIYLNSRTAPLPDINAALLKKQDVKKISQNDESNTNDNSNKGKEKRKIQKPKAGSLTHLVGYIPHRGDFDVEYENDAELTLADMEFKPEDSKDEREIKLKVLQIYNSKLDARAERKRFILERGLLESQPKRQTKEEREIEESMRVFARFHSKEEHEAFVNGLINELRIRKRIEQLQTWRLNGIRTIADGERFEAELQRRETGNKTEGGRTTANSRKRSLNNSNDGGPFSSGASKRRRGNSKGETSGNESNAVSDLPPIDISNMDGQELLSNPEKELCTELRIIPRQYICMKEALLSQAVNPTFWKQNKRARELLTVNIPRANKVIDFCVDMGWIDPQHKGTLSEPITTSQPHPTAASSSFRTMPAMSQPQ